MAELTALGLRAKPVEGGATWTGGLRSVAAANLCLHTASRILVRAAEFRATAFFELERHAKRVPWERFVVAGGTVEFRVTCRKSKLYHSDAVAQRLAEAVTRRVPHARVAEPRADDDEEIDKPPGEQLFIVRFFHDVCTISADSSGELLHRRGYRQQLGKAPLRETLAAAALMGAGWNGDAPLVDPMCGSGTIAIEAARLARRIAPGRDRSFAFVKWPECEPAIWSALLDEARHGELASSPVSIAGYDRDAGAIAAATANAERAGVAADIDFRAQPISSLAWAPPPGMMLSNPPYGVRVGDPDRLRNLYAQLGNIVRARRRGWTLGLVSADRRLERRANLDFQERFRTRNGGIAVHLIVARVPNEAALSGQREETGHAPERVRSVQLEQAARRSDQPG